MDTIPEISVAALMERYEVLLFDAYGVLVKSGGALPGAQALIQRLNQSGKPFFILTNDASKLPQTAARRYGDYGLVIAPERIITSGALLASYFSAHGLQEAPCAVLGTDDSRKYVEQAGGRVVPAGENFEALVIADELGFPFLETVDTALTSLFRVIDHGQEVHLVLPNPDLIYPKVDQGFGFGAGSVAAMFQAALRLRYPLRSDLLFKRLGKPEKGLFVEALQRSGTKNMVMIGDQLETDIHGARAFGIDAVWIETGVALGTHADGHPTLQPTYRMRSLLP